MLFYLILLTAVGAVVTENRHGIRSEVCDLNNDEAVRKAMYCEGMENPKTLKGYIDCVKEVYEPSEGDRVCFFLEACKNRELFDLVDECFVKFNKTLVDVADHVIPPEALSCYRSFRCEYKVGEFKNTENADCTTPTE